MSVFAVPRVASNAAESPACTAFCSAVICAERSPRSGRLVPYWFCRVLNVDFCWAMPLISTCRKFSLAVGALSAFSAAALALNWFCNRVDSS